MSELLKQLESQHGIKIGQQEIAEENEEFEETYNENDEIENELANFDKRIKTHKEAQRYENGDFSNGEEDSSDSDSNPYGKPKKNKKVLFGADLEKPPVYRAPDINKIQSNIMTQQKAKIQASEDYQIQELLATENDSLKERKIKELYNKNRNLNVQYEREKSLRIKMEKQLNQVIKDNEEAIKLREEKMGITNNSGYMSKPRSGTQRSSYNGPISSAQSEYSYDGTINGDVDWHKKFQQADKKVQELRVNYQAAKNELNKANRVITREIGDNFNVDKVLMEENSWKGRAQMIEKLKGKVKDLQQKLGYATNMSQMSGMSEISGGGGFQSTFQGGKLDKTAAERRKEIENLKNEKTKISDDYDLILSKLKAVTSRKNNLEQEIKEIKVEMDKNKKIFLGKSQNDDKLIQTLKIEYERLKKSKNAPRVIYKNDCDHDHRDPSVQEQEISKMKKENQFLKEELKTKEGMIEELIEEKLKYDQSLSKKGRSSQPQVEEQKQGESSQKKGMGSEEYDLKIKKLQEELKVLKQERSDLFNKNISDKDSRIIIKDLSMQNAKLRAKVDDLQQQIKKLSD